MQTAVKLYSLDYKQSKTYLIAALFVIGNLLLPQLCHLMPQGGLIFLPIYFFTLIAAYKYGWKVGLLTAVLSPLLNTLLFNMPPVTSLPGILMKSIFLATFAGVAASYFKKVTIGVFALIVLAYQSIGTLVEWGLYGSLFAAMQDFRLGIPGMLLQMVGGYVVVAYLIRK